MSQIAILPGIFPYLGSIWRFSCVVQVVYRCCNTTAQLIALTTATRCSYYIGYFCCSWNLRLEYYLMMLYLWNVSLGLLKQVHCLRVYVLNKKNKSWILLFEWKLLTNHLVNILIGTFTGIALYMRMFLQKYGVYGLLHYVFNS